MSVVIAATEVRALRERTGAGMMECKRALEESAGNVESAIEWLRKQGMAKAAKKATRTAKEGQISTWSAPDGSAVVLVEVHCETDFVVKTEEFQRFAKEVTELAGTKGLSDPAALLAQSINGTTVEQWQTELTAKIGENIGVSRVVRRAGTTPTHKVAQYIHAGSKIGVLVSFNDPANQLTPTIAKDVAMHVAAMNPQFVRRDQISADVIAREQDIARAQLADQKKPPEIIEKILVGRIAKFYSEVCLLEQIFVKDPQGKQTIAQAIKAVGDQIEVLDAIRVQVGTNEDR